MSRIRDADLPEGLLWLTGDDYATLMKEPGARLAAVYEVGTSWYWTDVAHSDWCYGPFDSLHDAKLDATAYFVDRLARVVETILHPAQD